MTIAARCEHLWLAAVVSGGSLGLGGRWGSDACQNWVVVAFRAVCGLRGPRVSNPPLYPMDTGYQRRSAPSGLALSLGGHRRRMPVRERTWESIGMAMGRIEGSSVPDGRCAESSDISMVM